MITIPQEIKDLLHQDHCWKNFRICFPNGERSDVCNNLIVKDTVQFTESLCSQDSLKFGLCEASIFECETVGVGNVEGARIEVFCEVECPQTVSGSVFRTDLQKYVYPISYGMFTIAENKRQADIIHRKIVAYSNERLNNLNKCEDLYNFINTNWYDNSSISIRSSIFKLILGGYNQAYSEVELDTAAHYYKSTYPYALRWGPKIEIAMSISNYGYSAHETLYYFRNTWIKFAKEFDFDTYLDQCKVFHDQVQAVLDRSVALSDAVKKDIITSTYPRVFWSVPDTFEYEHAKSTDGVNYYADYTIGASDDELAAQRKYKTIDKKQEIVHLCWLIFKNITKTSTVQEQVVANSTGGFIAPSDGMKITIPVDGGSETVTFEGYDLAGQVFTKANQIGYSTAENIPFDAYAIPRDLQTTQSRTKTTYNSSGDPTGTSIVTRTEYRPSGDLLDFSPYDCLEASFELRGKIGKTKRDGDIEEIDIREKFGLTPNNNLYPNTNLYPEGVIGGRLLPQDYQSCWYDDEYTKPYGAIIATYTDSQIGAEVNIKYYFNDFSEESPEENYLLYDITGNFLLKNRSYTEAEMLEIMAGIAEKLQNVKYIPVDFTGRGLPYVEAGDTFEILTRSNDSITTIVLRRVLTGEQTLTDNYKSVSA